MADREVTVARIYIREAEHLLADILKFLHDEEKVAGAVVLRGVAGFGADGIVRTASLVDLSLDLPLVVEFYDRPERVEAVVEKLLGRMKLAHVVFWPARSFVPDGPP
jgi:PII-like signaling protein